jgi:hypothetical protein
MSHDSSKAFDRPLRVELGPSPLLLRVGLAVYLTAAALCLGSLLPMVLLLPLALHFGYLHGLHVGAWLPGAVAALSWDPQRGWRVRRSGGDWLEVWPMAPTFVSARLVAVRFKTGGWRRCSALVVADRCDADDFRRLRVRLLQSAHGHRDRTKIPGG